MVLRFTIGSSAWLGLYWLLIFPFWVTNDRLYPCFSLISSSESFSCPPQPQSKQKRARTAVGTTHQKNIYHHQNSRLVRNRNDKSRRLRSFTFKYQNAHLASGRWYGDCRPSTGTELVPIILCRNCRLGVKPSCTRLTAGTSTNVN